MSCAAQKEIISAVGAPKAIGPYSHAVKACQFLYTSGQLDNAEFIIHQENGLTGHLRFSGLGRNQCHCFDFHRAISGQGGHLNGRSSRRVFLEELRVNCIHPRKIRHVPQKNRGF